MIIFLAHFVQKYEQKESEIKMRIKNVKSQKKSKTAPTQKISREAFERIGLECKRF